MLNEVPHFYVELPVKLQSKSNFRNGKGSGKRWQELVAFEQVVAATVRNSLPDNWDTGLPSQPTSERPIVAMVISANSRYDAANFSKSIADAVEGLVYLNDQSLRYPVAESVLDKKAKTIIGFALIPADSDPEYCRQVTANLLISIPSCTI